MKKNNDIQIGTPADIKNISAELKLIRAKLDIGASDWNREEKEAIAKAYYEITRIATGIGTTGNGMTSTGMKGKGRILDTGCASCVNSAVTIIKNYFAAIGEPIREKTTRPARKPVVSVNDDDGEVEAGINDDEHLFAPTNVNWRKNHESISAAAAELDYTFTENETTKAERIAALEKHITEINK